MASGDVLSRWVAGDFVPPASGFATPALRNGQLVWNFDAAADEAIIVEDILDARYAGGGLIVTLMWLAASATSGTTRWEVAIERQAEAGQDLDSDGFATANSVGEACAATSGVLQYTNIAFTSGAQMDSLVAGERFRVKISRDANGTTGTDDMAGDAQLVGVLLKET